MTGLISLTGPCTVESVDGSNNGAHDGRLAEEKPESLQSRLTKSENRNLTLTMRCYDWYN